MFLIFFQYISNMDKLIELIDAEPFVYGINFRNKVNLTIYKGENPTIVGANGSGKTKLAEMIAGKVIVRSGVMRLSFLPEGVHYQKGKVIKAGFESAYTMADYANMYYQQRFSSTENEWDSIQNVRRPTVENLVADSKGYNKEFWVEKLRLRPLFPKTLLMLSSGELRRFLIATILMQKPEIVIFDNPFIGLDAKTRADLNSLFADIADTQQMIFVVPDIKDIPQVSKSVIPCRDLEYFPKMDREAFLADAEFRNMIFKDVNKNALQLPEPYIKSSKKFDNAAILRNVTIKYPTRTLFEGINWTIRKGDKWSLSGPNGSGKSTLLSLITADNPRSYNMDIELFDRQRGSGESIWDIKKRIGYISAEMHLYFRENQPCKKVVASGLFDTQGLFRQCNEEQYQKAQQIMDTFGIGHLADRLFLHTSDGEQRLVLLARTMIKNPDLLILDEPLHGLDAVNKARAKQLINQYAAQPERTLILVTHEPANVPECVEKHFEL